MYSAKVCIYKKGVQNNTSLSNRRCVIERCVIIHIQSYTPMVCNFVYKVCIITQLGFYIAKDVQYYTPFFEKVCSYTHLRCAKLHTIF